MKVAIFVDKDTSAIARMAGYIKKANTHHNIRILPFHPKRPSEEQISAAQDAINWCDVIDYQYWKTAEMIRGMMGAEKPSVLTHHNPYDIDREDVNWSDYDMNVVLNLEQQKKMHIPSTLLFHPVDLNYWKFQSKKTYTEDKLNTVLMVAARIEGKKGILEVAQATNELGMKLVLVGRPSKPDYLKQVLEYDNVEYYENVTDDQLRDWYHKAGIHVCNSIDGFESGTLPILEAMSTGCVVLTRRIGHVPETYNGRNMVVREGKSDDVKDLKKHLKMMRDDYDGMLRMREAAWNTVKNRNIEIYGRRYSQIYFRLLTKKPLISVIIPTYNRAESLVKAVMALNLSSWDHFEVIICDDGSNDNTSKVKGFFDEAVGELPSNMTIKYIKVGQYKIENGLLKKTYGLAHARNMGILEAEGEWLLFLDDRLSIEPGAMAAFMEKKSDEKWLWGMKDNARKGFVENFSFVKRRTLIDMGMFSDVITQYGGMTQEIRKRAIQNDIKFEFTSNAKAKSHSRAKGKEGKLSDIVKSKTQCIKLGYE